jgi:uncharacterized protein YbbC (DUF1343 family)
MALRRKRRWRQCAKVAKLAASNGAKINGAIESESRLASFNGALEKAWRNGVTRGETAMLAASQRIEAAKASASKMAKKMA